MRLDQKQKLSSIKRHYQEFERKPKSGKIFAYYISDNNLSDIQVANNHLKDATL